MPDKLAIARDDPEARRETGPLYRFSTSNLYASGFAGVALGIARGVLDAFVEVARDKVPRGAKRTMRNNNVVQAQFAQADAKWRAARYFLLGCLDEIWDRAGEEAWRVEAAAQVLLLRDLYGNPFRPSPPLPPAVLGWNGGTVRRLARAAYDERRLPEGTLDNARLAVLGDALEDAGCSDQTVLAHLHEPGVHVRGCWVLDRLLARD